MKKLLSLTICLCLLLGLLAGCGKAEPSGRYDLLEFTMNGISYSPDELEALGVTKDIYILFEEDHSGLLHYGTADMSFTWDSDTLTADEDSRPYRFEDGKVILVYQDTEMIFGQ